jgi:CubicO group peptidase (beta-lactamase class C family)
MSNRIWHARRFTDLGIVLALLLPASRAFAQPGERQREEETPVTGEILPGSEPLQRLDAAMREILARHEVPGAALAITVGGKLIVARGYGWANIEAREPVRPATRFDLASVSKSITAVATLRLVEENRLRLDERVFELLGQLRAPPGHEFDRRVRQITVRNLLNHSGGWDRDKPHGDPIAYAPRALKEFRLKPPVSADQLIYFVVGHPLDFDPGTQQHYSNFGYMTLGRVIEHVTGEPYARAVEQSVLHPMGIETIRMTPQEDAERGSEYLPNEAHRYFTGTRRSLPGGHGGPTGAAGGWCASAVAMCEFLTAVDGSRTGKTFLNEQTMRQMLAPPEQPLKVRGNNSWFGLGWDKVHDMPKWPHSRGEGDHIAYGKDGGVAGISTWIEHLPGDIDWCVLFNGSPKPHPDHPEQAERPSEAEKTNALQDTQKEVLAILREVQQWPSGDLFERFRKE